MAGVASPQDADRPAGACIPWESAGVWIPLGFPLLSVNSEKENLEMDERRKRMENENSGWTLRNGHWKLDIEVGKGQLPLWYLGVKPLEICDMGEMEKIPYPP